jgi:hypothetical protein
MHQVPTAVMDFIYSGHGADKNSARKWIVIITEDCRRLPQFLQANVKPLTPRMQTVISKSKYIHKSILSSHFIRRYYLCCRISIVK